MATAPTQPEATAGTTVPAVRFRGISKRFGGTVALDDVGFEIQPGAVHALLGGNGSGKSTLIKILSGVYQADDGWIEVGGERHDASRTTPDWARAAQIHVVHQGIGIFPELTVADNFALAHGYGARTLAPIANRRTSRDVAEVLARFELDISPRTRMAELPSALQVMVAVARALPNDEEAKAVIVLDEPTAALPQGQQQVLLEAIRGYRRRGHAVIMITHRLDEVVEVADEVTFLRDGRHLETTAVSGVDESLMVRRIAGMDAPQASRRPSRVGDEVRLEISELSTGPLRSVSLKAAKGEVLGLSGLLGAGAAELMLSLYGVDRPEAGTVLLDGEPIRFRDPAAAVAKGVVYLSDERQREGVFLDRSVRENLSLPNLRRYLGPFGISRGGERRAAESVIDKYQVVASSEEALISSMSGGNQQKIALARWLELEPRLLMLNEPTQGVDVRARAAIHELIHGAAANGTTVLVASSDPREFVELCDRVVGLWNGGISGEASGEGLTADRCLDLAYGGALKRGRAPEQNEKGSR